MRILSCILLLALNGLGIISVAQPVWSVNPHAYEFTMTITGKVVVDGGISADTGDVIGVFAGDECRGVAHVEFDQGINGHFVYLMAYSNKMGETLTFLVYDASRNEVLTVQNSLSFTVNAIVGSPDEPYLFKTIALSSSTKWHELEIRIFPNPFSNRLHMEIPDGAGNLIMKLYGSDGRLVKIWTESGKTISHPDTRRLPSGLYFLEWQGQHSAGMKKLIKN